MQDAFPIPSCFYSGDPAATKSGQTVVMSVYRTKIAGHSRLITVTWSRYLLVHGLSVSVESTIDSESGDNCCKVELRPWYFWRKLGSKRFTVEGIEVDVYWDLRSASFNGEPEPRSDYYVAVVSGDEVVLMVGDLKKEAYRRTGSRPAAIDAALLAKKEHVFGKKRFTTRAKLDEKGKTHEISIECICSSSGSSIGGNMDPEMVIKIDGHVVVHVKHLQWKFRGNDCISVNKNRLEVYWDVHDWLFSPGLRHALFIFKPIPSAASSTSSTSSTLSSLFSSLEGSSGDRGGGLSGYCLFLYAWKLE